MSKETEKADEIDRGIHKEIREKRTGVRKFMADLLNMHDGMMSYEEIDEMMLENTVIHGPNMWILCLAALIASIGLNMNSTAVIIGAMLISPLMSGIMTMGYSLAVRDLRLLRRALLRFGTQVVISLISSTVYFLITPIDTPTAEMIARTSPTIWDVLIALFGGIAGRHRKHPREKGQRYPGRGYSYGAHASALHCGLWDRLGSAVVFPRRVLSVPDKYAVHLALDDDSHHDAARAVSPQRQRQEAEGHKPRRRRDNDRRGCAERVLRGFHGIRLHYGQKYIHIP